MKKSVITILLSAGLFAASAQTPPAAPVPSPWKRELQTGLNINQATYSDNWKSGGVNSLALNVFLNGRLEYKTDQTDWTNDLQLLYGNIQNKGQGTRKNADRIFFESKYAYRLTKVWNAFGSATFMSQFAAGYDYNKDITGLDSIRRISGFLAPGYLTEALGIEYKPVDYFSAQFGVGALRQTFVTDQSLYTIANKTELYGVKQGENMRNQIVFQFVANYDKEILKNITLKARYMGVVDYQKMNGQGIVHRLDANLTAKVNRFVNVNLAGVILYDYDQDHDVQFSQVLSLGILYSINK